MTEEGTIEVTAEVIEPTNALEVTYTPAVFADNLAALEAYVDRQIEPYIGAQLDPNDYEQIKMGRACMADLNKLKEPIETERKRIKRAYEAPLKEFEARVKGITSKIDDARANIKAQVDDADARFKEMRREMLAAEYEGCVGVLASVIPFDAILDEKWLNRSTMESKAINELYEKAGSAAEGYETLQTKELKHKDEVVKHYAETLNLIAALKLEDELNERDRKMAEFKAKQEAAAAVKAERTAQPPAPEPEPAPEPVTQAAAPVCRWSLAMEFQGTEAFAKQVAETLKGMGITGASIKFAGVIEDEQ